MEQLLKMVKEKYVTKSGYLLQVNDGNNNLANGITVEINQKNLLAALKEKKILYYKLSPSEYKGNDMKTIDGINTKYSGNGDIRNYIGMAGSKDENAYRTSLISDMGETLLDIIYYKISMMEVIK